MKIGLMLFLSLSLFLPAASSLAAISANMGMGSFAAQGENERLKVTSSQQAVKMVKRRYPGKVLKVSSNKSGYSVKLLSKDGQVFHVNVNAKSGSMSR